MDIPTYRSACPLRESHPRRSPSGMLLLSSLFFLLLLSSPYTCTPVQAQRVALKTNLADWATASPNLGAEFALSGRFSLDLSATVAPFRCKPDLYFKHIRLQPELRYWPVTLLAKHYFGVTAFYSSYDLGRKDKAWFGDSYAAGLAYGYNWILSRRWNFELSAGVGAIRYRLARYTPGTEHPEPDETGWTVAPVRIGIAFIYVLK